MNRTHRTLLRCAAGPALALLAALTLFAGRGAGAAPSGAPPPARDKPASCTPQWAAVDSPDPGLSSDILTSVAVVSAGDAWAVGEFADDNTYSQALVVHWNGSAWTRTSAPNQGSKTNYLYGVAAQAGNDVWAVGMYAGSDSVDHTLVEHWNGTAWAVVPSPDEGMSSNTLYGVVALSPTNAWAVGDYTLPNLTYQTLIEHWDGSTWTVAPSPNPGSANNLLYGVAALSADDVWAVGDDNSTGSAYVTLTEHWDGSTWTAQASPNPGGSNYLHSVAAGADGALWTVGLYTTQSTLAERRDGATWTVVPSLDPGSENNFFSAVHVAAAGDVWAVGAYSTAQNMGQTLAEHWDGSAWTVVASESPGSEDNNLQGIAAVSATDLWAVGYRRDAGTAGTGFGTLIERYTACPTTATPTPNPPGSPTATPTPNPPGSPTATPTPPDFSDVPPGSPFYTYVTCLVGQGLISGYADGTFRPNADVTRGQLAKIVANAAGFSEPQSAQMFQDVPLSAVYQVYIGRLAARGVIGGYACGGPDEPCVPPANLPYFRANNNATRGQIAKIDANAAGFGDPPGGQQFADVPAGSPFYLFAYRLGTRAIMSGYACGGPGEPCVPPANLPYFRANNNATRGQTAKIVANTFFPACSARVLP